MSEVIRNTAYAASKTFTMKGTAYVPGDPVDVTMLADYKIGQLLRNRFIRPAPVFEYVQDTGTATTP